VQCRLRQELLDKAKEAGASLSDSEMSDFKADWGTDTEDQSAERWQPREWSEAEWQSWRESAWGQQQSTTENTVSGVDKAQELAKELAELVKVAKEREESAKAERDAHAKALERQIQEGFARAQRENAAAKQALGSGSAASSGPTFGAYPMQSDRHSAERGKRGRSVGAKGSGRNRGANDAMYCSAGRVQGYKLFVGDCRECLGDKDRWFWQLDRQCDGLNVKDINVQRSTGDSNDFYAVITFQSAEECREGKQRLAEFEEQGYWLDVKFWQA
jgi:hypothetical protein